MRAFGFCCGCVAALAAFGAATPSNLAIRRPLRTQAEDRPKTFETVEFRVSQVDANGILWIDRGEIDGLLNGDLVRLFPTDGRDVAGSVIELRERSAGVELFSSSTPVPPGTRGRVRVPSGRFDRDVTPEISTPEDAEENSGGGAVVPDPSADESATLPDGYVQEPNRGANRTGSLTKPLLSQMESMRPDQRRRSISGRAYLSFDGIRSSLDNRHDVFLRAGQDLLVRNPLGRGGAFHLDLEQNYRRAEIPGPGDENTSRLRVDRLSYAFGGDRFAKDRYELGRFLQYGVPEFGVLDGVEYGSRRDNGDRFGASVGFLPEPTPEQETGRDLQFSAWYRWVFGEEERLSTTAGYQKTLHDGNTDRDLFLAKVEMLPADDWRLYGTAWIDVYSGGDDAKGSGLGLTQVNMVALREFGEGTSLDLSYRHLEFPELDRNEFLTVVDEQIADDHSDRIWLNGSKRTNPGRRMHGRVGAWVDQDDAGGDIEGGYEFEDLLGKDSRADVTFFGGSAKFNRFFGTRVQYGQSTPVGRWNFLYEFVNNEQEDFDLDADELQQHRVRASQDWFFDSGWNLSLYGMGVFWDDENSFSAGFFLQRNF